MTLGVRNGTRVAGWAVVALLLLATWPNGARAQAGGWQRQDPGATADSLHGVWANSGSDVVAVGEGGTFVHSDGAGWSAMSSGTAKNLHGVWGSSGDDVFAVGADGTIVHYDGSAWSPMSSGTTRALYGVWGSRGDDVFAVGHEDIILHYDGSAWSSMYSGTWWPQALYGVWGSSGSDVLAVGYVEDDVHGILYSDVMHYDGSGWHSGVLDFPWEGILHGVWGSNGQDVFAVGEWGLILHYDGTSWTDQLTGSWPHLHGVWGGGPGDVFAVGEGGSILHYGAADLALAQAVQPGTTLFPGQPITFTLAFQNTGSLAGTGALITDVVPVEVTNLAFASHWPITPTGTPSYTWRLGDLPPGAQGVITVTGVVSPGLAPGHAFTNTATLTSTMLECCPADNAYAVRLSIQAAPVAAGDAYTTSVDLPLLIPAPGVLGNDQDPNDDPLTALLDSPPLSGTLLLHPDGSFVYTPTAGFVGLDAFTYHANDGLADSDPAMVVLAVVGHLDRFLYLPLVIRP
jgi:uncharacterized repeat protein (TIGR01451 family)